MEPSGTRMKQARGTPAGWSWWDEHSDAAAPAGAAGGLAPAQPVRLLEASPGPLALLLAPSAIAHDGTNHDGD